MSVGNLGKNAARQESKEAKVEFAMIPSYQDVWNSGCHSSPLISLYNRDQVTISPPSEHSVLVANSNMVRGRGLVLLLRRLA